MSKQESPSDLLPGKKRYVAYLWLTSDPGRCDDAPAEIVFEADTVDDATRLAMAAKGCTFFIVQNRYTRLFWSHRYDPITGWVIWKNKTQEL